MAEVGSENQMEGNTTVPPTHPQYVSVLNWDFIVILQLICAVTGIIGNTLVIVVYVYRHRMRNTTNAFIVNLAVADLCTSLFIIPLPYLTQMPDEWQFRLYCKLVFSSVMMWISIVASILTLTMVSLERYFAVVHPLRYRVIFSRWRPKAFIAGTWMLSLIINTFILYVVDLGDGFCYNNWPSIQFRHFFAVMVFVLEYFLPMVIMLASNVIAIRTLKAQARSLLKHDQSRFSPAYSLLEARKKVIETLLFVIITFIICWSPDQFGFLVYHFGTDTDDYLIGIPYRLLVLLAFLNSCANPIIYAFKNKSFRHGFMDLLRRKGNRVGSTAESLAGDEDFNTANTTVRTFRTAPAPSAVPKVL